ncbi:FAD-dependent tricarballylate dehydrogenase TcuA [Rhodopseudomonas pseudopalustris]|uniref:FAD-dependent tricarballylate dehydrogenase TcuA n=1 Tax=Rhodopseudomonas pseudopalustris TaxID=1513892 RepID=UPI003F97786D
MIARQDCEVLVIGGGCAALCAAIAARRRGADVLMIDHAPFTWRGGNTRHARNFRIAHDEADDYVPGRYPAAAFAADLARVAPDGDAALAALLAQHSQTLTNWLRAQSVRLQRRGRGVMPWSQRTAFFAGGGKAAMDTLYATARRLGITILHDAEACGIEWFGDRVTAVEVVHQGAMVKLRAASVIACCGGHQANRDWLREGFGAAADAIAVRGMGYVQGRLLRALIDAGAATVGDPGRGHIVAVDARGPAVDGGIVTRLECIPYGIVVDRDAQRFADEGGDTARTHYARWGERLLAAPGQRAALILDRSALARAASTAFAPLRAPTIEALAELIDLDGAALRATVDRYNAAIVPADPNAPESWRAMALSPPKSAQALPISEPPFAAFPLIPGITFTHYGVGVDGSLRVRRDSAPPFANLFAAGMIMAANVLPRGYLAGLGVTISAVFGRLAGEEAARHAGR